MRSPRCAVSRKLLGAQWVLPQARPSPRTYWHRRPHTLIQQQCQVASRILCKRTRAYRIWVPGAILLKITSPAPCSHKSTAEGKMRRSNPRVRGAHLMEWRVNDELSGVCVRVDRLNEWSGKGRCMAALSAPPNITSATVQQQNANKFCPRIHAAPVNHRRSQRHASSHNTAGPTNPTNPPLVV